MNDNSLAMNQSLKTKAAALRRQHILEAAARTFAEAGYQRTTIRDVAKAAGVADGTIYNNFANKADLLLSLLDPLAHHLPPEPVRSNEMLGRDSGGIAGLLRDRWSALNPETIDLLRTILSEALVDRALGDAFRARVLDPAIDPLGEALSHAGLPEPELAARVATAAFLGFAVLKMLGDSVAQTEDGALPDRIAAILTAITDKSGA